MLSLRAIRRKIRAAQKTRQITRTMQMVAASRLRRSEGSLQEARPYADKMAELLARLATTGEYTHPYFEKRPVENTGLVIITSDRGLCGAYNANIIATAEGFLNKLNNNAKIILLGKKGFDYFNRRKKWEILYSVTDLGGRLNFGRIEEITRHITDFYLNGTVDEVYIVYTKFYSALSLRPTLIKFLNIEQEQKEEQKELQYIFEPGVEEICKRLLPRYATTRIYMSLAESFTSENAARMMAMKQATDNAGELIERLTLMRNKARQAAITKEIAEIVTAAEALKY